MAHEKARQVAEAILEDLRGAGYYRDPAILGQYLRGHVGPQGKPETVAETAGWILDDLRGAGYYKDPEVLAGLLEGRLGWR